MKYALYLTLALFGATATSFASEPILVGQTADFTSLAAVQMKQFNTGAMAYIDKVNKAGGIRGRPIKIILKDDAYVADMALRNAKELVEKDGVVALFGSRGTDTTEAVISVAEASKTPLIAPLNGSDAVRSSHLTFPVRASYRDEIDLMLKQMSLATTRLAVAAQDDKFGNPLIEYIDQVVRTRYPQITRVSTIRFPRKKADLFDEAHAVVSSGASSVIALCNPTSCDSMIKQIRSIALGNSRVVPTVYQTSISDVHSQYDRLGPALIAGLPYTQVLPDPAKGSSVTVREYRAAMAQLDAPVNYRTYEGYLSAIVLCEGLKRASALTRTEIIRAFESKMQEIDLGEVKARYNHKIKGLDFVDLVTVNKDGKIVH